jgi:hypothetical protein
MRSTLFLSIFPWYPTRSVASSGFVLPGVLRTMGSVAAVFSSHPDESTIVEIIAANIEQNVVFTGLTPRLQPRRPHSLPGRRRLQAAVRPSAIRIPERLSLPQTSRDTVELGKHVSVANPQSRLARAGESASPFSESTTCTGVRCPATSCQTERRPDPQEAATDPSAM